MIGSVVWAASERRPGVYRSLPPSPLDCRRGIPRRAEGIGFAVLLGLAAFLHQPGGGFVDTPSPIDRQQANVKSARLMSGQSPPRAGGAFSTQRW